MQRRKTSSRRSCGNCSSSGNLIVIVCIRANAAGSLAATNDATGGGGQKGCLSVTGGANLRAQREAIKTDLLNEAAAIFRLDTQYGGGKTHSLIALTHAARGMGKVANAGEFIDPSLVPRRPVRVARLDRLPVAYRQGLSGFPIVQLWGGVTHSTQLWPTESHFC